MAINFIEYRWELCNASRLVHNAMQSLQKPLVEDGFQIPLWLLPPQPEQFMSYASGKMFFQRVWNEVSSALSITDTLTENLAAGTSPVSQRLFDEVSLRQRKLFETFGLIAMLSRDAVYAAISATEPPKPELYFLHFHLAKEIKHLEHRNKDLIRYFGGLCNDTDRQTIGRERLRDELVAVHHINGTLCNWNWNERRRFESLLSECTPLERTAIGFGYQQIFGAASNQVHLNMTATYDPEASEREFLKRVDNLLILAICVILRAVKIAELAHGQLANHCRALRDEFTGALPNSYEGAVIGSADVDDIVSVFSSPDIFIGIVREKWGGTGIVTEANANAANNTAGTLQAARRTAITTPTPGGTAAVTAADIAASAAASASAEYVSYRIEPLLNVGRVGRYIDIETQIILRANDLQSALNDGVTGGVITQAHIDAGVYFALSRMIQAPGAFAQHLQAYMNRANRPYLYFVQRYLRRLVESRAYFLWVERGRAQGEELRNWLDAEREVLNR